MTHWNDQLVLLLVRAGARQGSSRPDSRGPQNFQEVLVLVFRVHALVALADEHERRRCQERRHPLTANKEGIVNVSERLLQQNGQARSGERSVTR